MKASLQTTSKLWTPKEITGEGMKEKHICYKSTDIQNISPFTKKSSFRIFPHDCVLLHALHLRLALSREVLEEDPSSYT